MWVKVRHTHTHTVTHSNTHTAVKLLTHAEVHELTADLVCVSVIGYSPPPGSGPAIGQDEEGGA